MELKANLVSVEFDISRDAQCSLYAQVIIKPNDYTLY